MMEIDTGASYFDISGTTHKQLWQQKRIMPTTVKLCTYMYTGESLAVKGSMMAHIHYGDKEVKLSSLVLTDDGPSLLGRDWLQHLKLGWQQINKLLREALQHVLHRHEDVFQRRTRNPGRLYSQDTHHIRCLSSVLQSTFVTILHDSFSGKRVGWGRG